MMKMEPIKVKKLPVEYNFDKELLRLLAEANEKYGEYKSLIKNIEFDSKYFLDSIILSESLKSTQIEGTQISQDEMYFLKYMANNNDKSGIENLKEVISYSKEYIKSNNLNLIFINNIYKILLNSVRGNEKEPWKICTIQNWIGPKEYSIVNGSFSLGYTIISEVNSYEEFLVKNYYWIIFGGNYFSWVLFWKGSWENGFFYLYEEFY